MKALAKFVAPILLTTLSATALADDQSKIVIAQNLTFSGCVRCDVGVITNELHTLLDKADEVGGRFDYCGFDEQYYLGHGNGDSCIIDWKAMVVNGNVVRATFNRGSPNRKEDSHLVEFVMQGDRIADVRHAWNDNPNVFPTRTTSSLKQDAQRIVRTNGRQGC